MRRRGCTAPSLLSCIFREKSSARLLMAKVARSWMTASSEKKLEGMREEPHKYRVG